MPHACVNTLHRKLRTLDYTQKRMEGLFAKGKVTKTDLHVVYESLFLRAVTSFEAFLEELFIAILSRKTRYKKSRKVVPRAKFADHSALMNVVMQGKSYVDWLPFDRTQNRARIFLEDGRPFTSATPQDITTLQTITTIRNAIAHSSKFAMSKFNRAIEGQPLLRSEKKPAGYLRSQMRIAPVQNRFEVYVAELGRIALDLG